MRQPESLPENFVYLDVVKKKNLLTNALWLRSTKRTQASSVSCGSGEQSWESTFENVLQPIGAEVEFHVCNYWTTGCKGSIWSGKEKQEGGVGQDVRPGWKVKKRQQHTKSIMSLFALF